MNQIFVPEKDAIFSNWGTSWWKLKDEVTEQMLEEQVGALGNDATWIEALISLLNDEITKSTSK